MKIKIKSTGEILEADKSFGTCFVECCDVASEYEYFQGYMTRNEFGWRLYNQKQVIEL